MCTAIGSKVAWVSNVGATDGSHISTETVLGSAQPPPILSASNEPLQKANDAPMVRFSEKEEIVLKAMLSQDLDVFAQGGKSAFGESPDAQPYVVTIANELQKEYENNEVAGDKRFRRMAILLRGNVASIDRSIGENYFVSLVGGTNMFLHPKAKMADGYTDYMAELKKGQAVQLACIGDGMLMGSAMVSNCRPYEIWRDETVNALVTGIPSRAKSGDKASLVMATMAIVVTPSLPATSACWSDKSTGKCSEEISKKIVDKMHSKSKAELRGIVAARLQIAPSELDKLTK